MTAGAVAQPLNPMVWLAAPSGACLVGTLLVSAPLEIGGVGLPQPVLAMVCAFAWGVIRPSVLAPFVLLLLGLVQDLLWGNRLGLWPSALLATHAVAALARSAIIGHGFWALWAWYLGASATGFAAAFLLTALAVHEIPNLALLALQYAATGAVFWFAWKLIERFEDADVRFR